MCAGVHVHISIHVGICIHENVQSCMYTCIRKFFKVCVPTDDLSKVNVIRSHRISAVAGQNWAATRFIINKEQSYKIFGDASGEVCVCSTYRAGLCIHMRSMRVGFIFGHGKSKQLWPARLDPREPESVMNLLGP